MRGWIKENRFRVVPLTERKGDKGRQDFIIDRRDLDAFLNSLKLAIAAQPPAEKGKRRPLPVPTGVDQFRARIKKG